LSREIIVNFIEILTEYETGVLSQNRCEYTNEKFELDLMSKFITDNAHELRSSLRNILLDSEYYKILPKEIRDFLESSPETMFSFIRRLNEAVSSREKIHKLSSIIEHTHVESNTGLNCYRCNYFLINNQIREILNDEVKAELSG
jgi:signal transduction histidine kinase